MLAIAVAVFAPMVRTVAGLFTELFAPVLNFRVVIAEVLFSLVLVEVVRLVIIYLQEHRVAIEFMVDSASGHASGGRAPGCHRTGLGARDRAERVPAHARRPAPIRRPACRRAAGPRRRPRSGYRRVAGRDATLAGGRADAEFVRPDARSGRP